MNLQESNNRALNLMALGFFLTFGVGLLPTIFEESEWLHRVDDMVVPVLCGIGVIWYFTGRNRFSRSIVPIAVVGLLLLNKLALGIGTERNDRAGLSDDLGVSLASLVFVIVAIVVYVRAPSEERRH